VLHAVRPRASPLGGGPRGAHQRANAAAAVAAAQVLAEHGTPFRADAVERGLRALWWPGRFEVLAGAPTIVLDGAHNDGSALALADTLRREFPRRRVRFVLGVMADRTRAPWFGRSSRWREPSGDARAGSAVSIRAGSRGSLAVPVRIHGSSSTRDQAARTDATPREIVCVTGSFAHWSAGSATCSGFRWPSAVGDDGVTEASSRSAVSAAAARSLPRRAPASSCSWRAARRMGRGPRTSRSDRS
jgi:hypothetical protein